MPMIREDIRKIESDIADVRRQLSHMENLCIFNLAEGRELIQNFEQYLDQKIQIIEVDVKAYELHLKRAKLNKQEYHRTPRSFTEDSEHVSYVFANGSKKAQMKI